MIFESLSRLLAKLIFLTHLSSAAEILTNPTLTHSPRQQSTDPAYTDDSFFQTTALDNQNFYRVEHGAVNMTWSTSLASSSEAWSEQCIWAHSVHSSFITFYSYPQSWRVYSERLANNATGFQPPLRRERLWRLRHPWTWHRWLGPRAHKLQLE